MGNRQWGLAHMTPYRSDFHSYQEIEETNIDLADDHTCKTVGVGTVLVKCKDLDMKLETVYHVPTLRGRLFSAGALMSKGADIIMKAPRTCTVERDGKFIFEAVKTSINILEMVHLKIVKSFEVNLVKEDIKLWHSRLGHISYKRLLQM